MFYFQFKNKKRRNCQTVNLFQSNLYMYTPFYLFPLAGEPWGLKLPKRSISRCCCCGGGGEVIMTVCNIKMMPKKQLLWGKTDPTHSLKLKGGGSHWPSYLARYYIFCVPVQSICKQTDGWMGSFLLWSMYHAAIVSQRPRRPDFFATRQREEEKEIVTYLQPSGSALYVIVDTLRSTK